MTDREKLIELLRHSIVPSYAVEPLADFLLANGVVIPTRCGNCKNYDVETAWCSIHSCFIDRNGKFCHPWENYDWKMFDGAYYCADGERRAEDG